MRLGLALPRSSAQAEVGEEMEKWFCERKQELLEYQKPHVGVVKLGEWENFCTLKIKQVLLV